MSHLFFLYFHLIHIRCRRRRRHVEYAHAVRVGSSFKVMAEPVCVIAWYGFWFGGTNYMNVRRLHVYAACALSFFVSHVSCVPKPGYGSQGARTNMRQPERLWLFRIKHTFLVVWRNIYRFLVFLHHRCPNNKSYATEPNRSRAHHLWQTSVDTASVIRL